jgi:hypothetical protein
VRRHFSPIHLKGGSCFPALGLRLWSHSRAVLLFRASNSSAKPQVCLRSCKRQGFCGSVLCKEIFCSVYQDILCTRGSGRTWPSLWFITARIYPQIPLRSPLFLIRLPGSADRVSVEVAGGGVDGRRKGGVVAPTPRASSRIRRVATARAIRQVMAEMRFCWKGGLLPWGMRWR